MNIAETIFLGIVQGIAEFLPVSSSGHLAIFKNIFGLQEMGITFDVLLHLGTLLAVFLVYWKDIKKLIIDGIGIIVDCFRNIITFIRCKIHKTKPQYIKVINSTYRRFALLIIVSTIPTGIIGILASDLIESVSAGLIIPGICLLITGVLLLISDSIESGMKKIADTSYKNAIIIGIAQGFATLPGISRSGTTITACLLSKFDRSYAVKYSFIMSIPAILGAAIVELKDIGSENLSSGLLINYLIGMVVAAVVGYISIKTMLIVVRNKKFKYFAYYCFLAGTFAIVGNFVI